MQSPGKRSGYIEGSSSSALFSITVCQAVTLPLGMSEPNLRSLLLPNISAISLADLSIPSLVLTAQKYWGFTQGGGGKKVQLEEIIRKEKCKLKEIRANPEYDDGI